MHLYLQVEKWNFIRHVTQNQDELTNVFVSPLINGKFHNLPPAYIMGAEVDSLLIDSVEYHNRLQENNIQSELVIEKD